MEETIDLKEYFLILKKKAWLIVLSAIVCGVISGLVSYFLIDPVYEANTTVIVNKEENEETKLSTSDDLNFVQKLAVTYGEIIKSRTVITSAINELKLDTTYEEMKKSISVTNVSDTQIIKISAQSTNPQMATNICNAIPEIFTREVTRLLNVSAVEVIDRAIIPKNPIKPNKTMNIAIASLLGAMVSIFFVFLKEALNTKIKEPKEIEEKLGIPVFGVIPKF